MVYKQKSAIIWRFLTRNGTIHRRLYQLFIIVFTDLNLWLPLYWGILEQLFRIHSEHIPRKGTFQIFEWIFCAISDHFARHWNAWRNLERTMRLTQLFMLYVLFLVVQVTTCRSVHHEPVLRGTERILQENNLGSLRGFLIKLTILMLWREKLWRKNWGSPKHVCR